MGARSGAAAAGDGGGRAGRLLLLVDDEVELENTAGLYMTGTKVDDAEQAQWHATAVVAGRALASLLPVHEAPARTSSPAAAGCCSGGLWATLAVDCAAAGVAEVFGFAGRARARVES